MTSVEFKDIITAISALGFPIVIALLLFWQNTTQTRYYMETLIQRLNELENKISNLSCVKGGDNDDTAGK